MIQPIYYRLTTQPITLQPNIMSRICNDWFIRVGDGANFDSSYKYNVYGLKPTDTTVKGMLDCIRDGDRLWFVTNKSKGRIIASAIYVSHNGFVNSPGELTNIELGWTDEYIGFQLIQYTNLYLLYGCRLYVNNLPRGTCVNNQSKKTGKQYMKSAGKKYKYLSMFHAAMKMN